MNTRLLIGIVLLVLGIIVLIAPRFLDVIVGIGLILVGLYIALQGAPRGGNI